MSRAAAAGRTERRQQRPAAPARGRRGRAVKSAHRVQRDGTHGRRSLRTTTQLAKASRHAAGYGDGRGVECLREMGSAGFLCVGRAPLGRLARWTVPVPWQPLSEAAPVLGGQTAASPSSGLAASPLALSSPSQSAAGPRRPGRALATNHLRGCPPLPLCLPRASAVVHRARLRPAHCAYAAAEVFPAFTRCATHAHHRTHLTALPPPHHWALLLLLVPFLGGFSYPSSTLFTSKPP